MAAENVETLRRYHTLLNESGDLPVELLCPDVELHMFRGPYHGRDGARQWHRDTFDVIDDWRLELDDVIESGDPDVLVALTRFVGRMKHTNLPANFPLAVVVRFRDGLIVRFDGYRERDEALEAAGVEASR
jgi:ketosteroid isomerase-like protein